LMDAGFKNTFRRIHRHVVSYPSACSI
jgi:hypothetical protein